MKVRLSNTEYDFKEWLKRNPDLLNATVQEIAGVYGKSENRTYGLLKVLEEKGHIERSRTTLVEQVITLL